jgi:hypothetical protein
LDAVLNHFSMLRWKPRYIRIDVGVFLERFVACSYGRREGRIFCTRSVAGSVLLSTLLPMRQVAYVGPRGVIRVVLWMRTVE